MTVSMAALVRLFLYSFLFGLWIGLFYSLFCLATSFIRASDVPLPDHCISSLPKRVKEEICERRKGKAIKGAYFFLSFLGQTVFCLFCAAAVSVFYYCFNDGIPRLFSLLTVLLGFLLFQKTAGRYLSFAAHRLTVRLRLVFLYVRAYLIKPPLSCLVWLLLRVGRFLSAIRGRLLLSYRLILAPIKMKRYMKKELLLVKASAFLEELSD